VRNRYEWESNATLPVVNDNLRGPRVQLLCKDVAEVGAAQYRRATQVLTALTGVSPARVAGEFTKLSGDGCSIWAVWSSGVSALGAVLAKDPRALTADDALTIGFAHAPMIVGWSAPAPRCSDPHTLVWSPDNDPL
jgi:hypothetical protein